MVKNNILDAELSENLKNIKKELEKLKEEKISSEEKQQENISQNEKPEKFFKKKKDVIEIEISEQTVDSDEKRIPKKKRQPARKKPKVLESPIENEKSEISEISEISEEITPTKLKADTKEEKMYVIPLGGTDEVGKNMTVVQYRDEIIIMDCGVIFPDENLPGIDLVIPDFTYLENNKNKIKGLFITHGHEDHIGAIPYLYQKIDKSVPMYGGKLTLALVKSKFEGNNLTRHMPKGKEVRARQKIKIGKYFTIEFVKVTHSIADSYAIAVTTPAGTILNTGDFKIDLTPV
ncbi:MAG: MBL fold metallo-hydrolase, partial [Fusobacteriaceae bacterium]